MVETFNPSTLKLTDGAVNKILSLSDPGKIKEINLSAQISHRLQNKNYKGRDNINRLSRQGKYFPIKPQVSFHPDPKKQYTILEIISTDNPGLLAKIGHIFQNNDIVLHNAKISTIGGRVEDWFYITDPEHQCINDLKKLDRLKDDLLTGLTDELAARTSLLTH